MTPEQEAAIAAAKARRAAKTGGFTPEQQAAIDAAKARKAGAGPVTGKDGMTTAERIAAAKAGTLKVSPESAGRHAHATALAEQRMDDGGFNAFGSAFGKGVSYGFADEIAAGIGSLIEDRSYDEILSGLRGQDEYLAEQFPKSTIAGELTGVVASPVSKALAPAKGANLVGSMSRNALSGAAAGGLYGFGTGEGGATDRGWNALGGALGGAAIGGAIPAVGAGLRAGLDKLAESRAVKAAIRSAPSMDDLKAVASRLYDQADQVSNLPRADFAAAVPGMLDDAARSGMDDMLTPGAARVAGKLDDAAQAVDPNIGFRELDILRKQAGIPAGNVANRTEQSIGSKMIAGIDDFLDTVDPQLSGVVKEARDMWGQLRRSELIEKAIAKAPNAASGFENGLRIEFRKILNNPKLLRGFNEQEIAAIKAVAQGSKMGNLMRQIGRIGIGLSGQSNGLGATIGGIAGTALGGPVGGLVSVATGTTAKALTERATRKAAENALGVIGARNALSGISPGTYLPGLENLLAIPAFGAAPVGGERLGNALLPR